MLAMTRDAYDLMLATETLGRRISAPHRYKVGDTVHDKYGNAFAVTRLEWRQYRWHPLEPVYVCTPAKVKGVAGQRGCTLYCTLYDAQVW